MLLPKEWNILAIRLFAKNRRAGRSLFARRSLFILGIWFFALVLSSCNLFKSSNLNRVNTVKMKETGDCTVSVRQSFKDYVAGSATQAQVKTSLDCVAHDLEQFQLRTRSSTSTDQYSLQEVNAFFAKYFSDAPEFSLPSLTAYLKFKNFVVGGGETTISKSEIAIIENLINEANPVLANMAQYVNIYKLQKPLNLDNAGDAKEMSLAIESLHRLLTVLNKYFSGRAGAVFHFTDLDSLDFAEHAVGSRVSDTEAVQLIMNLKSILVSPPEDSVRGEDFSHFITQLDLILETALRIKYTRDLGQDRDEIFLRNVESLRDSVTLLFRNSFSFQSANSIPSTEIIKFLKKLDHYGLIPYGLKEPSVEEFLPTLLAKILAKNPPAKIPELANLSFTGEHFQTLLDSVNEWIGIQSVFLSAIDGRNEIRASDLIEKFEQEAARSHSAKLADAYSQMKEVLSAGTFLRWKDKDVLNFAPRNVSQTFTSYDLLFLSSSFSIVRKIIQNYMTDPARRKSVSALTEPELTQLYLEVRNLGKDLKFIDVRNTLAPSRAFLENNIFTSVSNGNNLVEFHEALEWFYQVWSAGNMGQKIYALTPDQCKTQELDVFDHRKLDHACFTAFFKSHVREFFENLPTVSIYLNQVLTQNPPPPTNQKKVSQDPWGDFEVALENSFRPEAYSTYSFDSPDTEAMSLILSYTEAVFLNHSRAYNGELDTTDVWNTYPIMRGFIESASNGAAKNEFIKRAAFSYLITFGEMPSADGFMNLAKFGGWSVMRNFHKEIAYTGDIVRVISTFSLASRDRKIKNIETYFTLNKTTIEANVLKKDKKTIDDLKDLLFCSDQISPYLASTLVKNADKIFTAGPPYTATSFHQSIEKLIMNDQRLALECLPFE